MKKVFILLLLAACGEKPMEKPFVVVNKYFDGGYGKGVAKYYYQDKYGREYDFVDSVNKYNIGDTIK